MTKKGAEMIYGIVYRKSGQGDRAKYACLMRQYEKFSSREEESRLSPFIRTIIEEETGDGYLLAEKIAQYARDNHIELDMPIDLAGIQRSACLSDDERLEMLETSVRVLARKLEESRRKLWETEYAHWCVSQVLGSAEYVLDSNNSVLKIAIEQFGDEPISEAIPLANAEYEKYRLAHLH